MRKAKLELNKNGIEFYFRARGDKWKFYCEL